MDFLIVIERGRDGSLSCYVPDLPGCVACGDDFEELRRNIGEAVKLHLESLQEFGEAIPVPTTVADTVTV